MKWLTIPQLGRGPLRVLVHEDGRELGSIQKPRDTRTDKNAWRCYKGIGGACQFLGHEWSEKEAKQKVLDSVAGL